MSKLLPEYKNVLIEDLISSITANSSSYYAFAANPIAYANSVPTETNDDYSSSFINNWLMIFGKKLSNTDIVPVIKNNKWTTNTVYTRYDNTSNSLLTNTDFYAITDPSTPGGYYHIYKCIDNANGTVSTVNPSTIATPTQETSFQTTPDNYVWRYVTSISTAQYNKFATTEYAPLYTNNTIKASAANNCGVELVSIANGGTNYSDYSNGTILSVVNSSLIQLAVYEPVTNYFYNGSTIYIQTPALTSSQLTKISQYISNTSGNWAILSESVNTSLIVASVSTYKISPTVIFETDGTIQPQAYCSVNSSTNSISQVIVLNKGNNISWANVQIYSPQGSGANVYAIINPPGGHGSDLTNELNVQGMGISFTFANTDGSKLLSNINYNKIGIIKNPYSLDTANNYYKSSLYGNSTFSHVLKANVSPSFTFSVGESLKGANSGARAIVLFSNSTQVFLTGDQHFQDGEYISNATSNSITTISINNRSDIYTKDLVPMYIQNINNITRSNTQSESYKLIIKL